MKYMFKIAPVFILLLFSGSALAGKWVIGGSLAAAKSDNDDAFINSQLDAQGLSATATTEATIRMPWQIYGGYNFFEQWGVELGYLDLDEVKITFTGTTVDIETFLNTVQDIHPQTAQGWLFSMNRYFTVDSSTRVKVRIGMYNWVADYTLQGGNATRSVNQEGTDISYGVGLELGTWHSDGVIGHSKWDHHSIDKKDISVIAFGFSFIFK